MAWICAGWTAVWLVLSLGVILTAWPTLERLQAGAAVTTNVIPAPTGTPSATAAAGSSTPPSTPTPAAPTATSSPAAPGSTSAVPGSSSTAPGSNPPATAPSASLPPGPLQAQIPILIFHQQGSFDLGMILLALAFGALGATAHCLYIFLGAVAGKKPGFTAYRIGWFFPQPPLGAILGALLYVAVRGGLLSSSSGASLINMFGVAAIAAVGGLSAPRAYQRLTGTSSSSDTTTAADSQKPTITDVSPASITAKSLPQKVSITGTDLTKATFFINGRPVHPDSVTATTAVLTVTAADAPNGYAVVSVAPNVGSSASVKIS